jgi:hypothetical protein
MKRESKNPTFSENQTVRYRDIHIYNALCPTTLLDGIHVVLRQ